jgi:hypothetical protein
MLRKVIKNDIKTLCVQFALIFGFGVIIPLLFYVMTGNLAEEMQFTLRLLVGSMFSMLVVIGTWTINLVRYDSDFNGKTSYLTHMLPVKVKTLLFSKTLIFFITTLLSFFFALLSMSLSIMNFLPFTQAYGFLEKIIQSIGTQNGYLIAVFIMIRSLLGIISIYGFICAGGAFGHLFGTQRKAAEALFEIGVVIIYVLYSTMFNGLFQFNSNISDGLIEFTGNVSVDIGLFCIDTVVAIAVTVGFFVFTNHVFTKKINVL